MKGSNSLAVEQDFGRTWKQHTRPSTKCGDSFDTDLKETRESKKVNTIKTELKPGAKSGKGRSIALRLGTWKGLEPLIDTLMQYGLLRDCQSESILLPVK